MKESGSSLERRPRTWAPQNRAPRTQGKVVQINSRFADPAIERVIAKPFHGLRYRETKPQKKCVCVKITISVSRLSMLWKLKLVLNHSAITKFVILNAEVEYFFIGYLFIVMRAAIFSY